MSSVQGITQEFVRTYYVILDEYYPSAKLDQFYNPHAQITRTWPNCHYSFKLINDPLRNVCPEDLQKGRVSIHSYVGTKASDNILINVYGSLSQSDSSQQGFWTQEFVLQRYELKWYIINDSFFSFTSAHVPLFGAESPISMPPASQYPQTFSQPSSYQQQQQQATMQSPIPTSYQNPSPAPTQAPTLQPQFQPQFQPQPQPQFQPTTISQQPVFQPQFQPQTYQAPFVIPQRPISQPYPGSRSESTRKPRYEMFDPSRSITIVLFTRYTGDEVCNYYTQFGNISDKYYTHGTVYLEFEDKKIKEAALRANAPEINGVPARVEDGIMKSRANTRPR